MQRPLPILWLFFFIVSFTCIGAADAARKLVIVAESWPPFEFNDPEKGAVGIDVDIIKPIFKKMGIDYEIQIITWARAWHKIQKGDADAALSVSRKPEREPYLYYPKEDMWVSEYVFFVRKDKKLPDFNGYADAKRLNLRIGVVPGNTYNNAFWEAFPSSGKEAKRLHPQLDQAKNMELNLKKLAKGRIDLYIVDKTIGLYAIKQLGLQDVLTYYPQPLFSKGYPMPFARNSTYPDIENVAAQFEEELIRFKETESYRIILDRWLN